MYTGSEVLKICVFFLGLFLKFEGKFCLSLVITKMGTKTIKTVCFAHLHFVHLIV